MRATLLRTTSDVTAMLKCAFAHVGIPLQEVSKPSALDKVEQHSGPDDFVIHDCSLNQPKDRTRCARIVARMAMDAHIVSPDEAFVRDLQRATLAPLTWLPPAVDWPSLLRTLRDRHAERLQARACAAHPSLSERQQAVLDLVLQGQTQDEIARTLGVATGTISTHVDRTKDKIGVSSTAELIVVARLMGDL